MRDRHLIYRTNADDTAAWPSHAGQGRDQTTSELLRLLRRHSPVSRADLVRLSGLTPPTVSAGIAKLQRRELVVSIGPGTSSGGRPPGLLELNSRQGYVIGVDIGGSHLRLALADLSSTIVGRWHSSLRTDRSPRAVTELVGTAVVQLLKQHKIPAKKVLELVAGVPGITDAIAGRVLSAPSLTEWHDIPFRDLLQSETGMPTTIENDVNLAALGESWRGSARGTANFVYLAVGTGVGAGIVVNNTLYHGANWSAGEIGYMLLPGLSSDTPTTDTPGAFESAIGGKSIEKAWAGLDSLSSDESSLRATDIFDKASAGDARARSILLRVAERLSMAVTNLSLILDVSLVVLGGGVGCHDALLQAMRRRLEQNEFAKPQLTISTLGGEAQIYGAIWLGLQTASAAGFRHRTTKQKTLLAVR